jgi:hypothetical protein
MRLFRYLLPALLLIGSIEIYAQKGVSDTAITIPMVYFQYGYQFPGADMADRFGNNSVLGGGMMVKNQHNWIFGAEYNFIFGNDTKDGFSILEDIMTSDGTIISGDGTPSVVALFERGHIGSVKFGKLIPVLSPNKNSGFFITAGLGVLTHKIRIEVENQSAPQLKGDYRRGYDRLTAGLQLSQAVGYMYFGKRNVTNLTISFEIFEGFTKGQRDYLFDTRQPGDESRLDLLFGPKIAWMIPFRKRLAQEFYYY